MCKFPLVTVIVAVYNDNPEYLTQALNSLRNQTYENIEVIVLDDSSNAETRSVVDSFVSDDRFRIVRKAEKMGFVKALNIGLEEAKGQYIARMDSDDISELDRIKKQVVYLENHEDISVIGGQMDIINENGEIISHRKYPECGIKLFLYSLIRDPLSHPTVMMKRKIVDEGFRYDESMKKAEDIDLWLRIMNHGYKIANLQDVLLKYRIENNFNEKRTGDQQRYVFKARIRNLSLRRPVFSFFSMIFTTIYRFAPRNVLASLYNNENGKGYKLAK